MSTIHPSHLGAPPVARPSAALHHSNLGVYILYTTYHRNKGLPYFVCNDFLEAIRDDPIVVRSLRTHVSHAVQFGSSEIVHFPI